MEDLRSSGLFSSLGMDVEPQKSLPAMGQMFDSIAAHYDIINRVLSFGFDIRWRNKLADMVDKRGNLQVLDVATGTGDLLIALLRRNPNIIKSVGMDISENMLKLCRKKTEKYGLSDRIELIVDDIMDASLTPNTFDFITVGFGLRNFPDVLRSLIKIKSLLKKGGTALILEFSMPERKIIRSLYRFYLHYFVPPAGGLLSGRLASYSYLSRSIQGFYRIGDICSLMRKAGFNNVTATMLTYGVACIYKGSA
jgi:demethylmenaquinone methyltransferase / 2-methoxy-6-polyprenyl-1,4-benzoquinol methylase